jgi:hypothetical protein
VTNHFGKSDHLDQVFDFFEEYGRERAVEFMTMDGRDKLGETIIWASIDKESKTTNPSKGFFSESNSLH